MSEQMSLPNPTEMSSTERLFAINEYRRRIFSGEKLPIEVLRHGVELLRSEQAHKSTQSRERKAAKAPVVAATLDEL